MANGATSATKRTRAVYEYSIRRRKALELREQEQATGPGDVVAFLRALGLHEEEQEHLLSIILDARNRIKAYTTVSIGLVDRTHCHPREVFRSCLLQGGSRILLAHNHPSGDPTPSGDDIDRTREMVEAGKILQIDVLDHVIVCEPAPGRPGYVSLKEEGLLCQKTTKKP